MPFRHGFTLVELMVVMVVISIMVGITIPVSKFVVHKSRESSQRVYIEKIKSALEDYRAAYGEYPITPPNPGSDNHYPLSYNTECFYTTNSPFTSVSFATSTVESVYSETSGGQTSFKIDYGLTYPLMLKQTEKGARPFMLFPEVSVAYLVYNAASFANPEKPMEGSYQIRRKKKSGGYFSKTINYIYGNPINRPEAIDPVSRCHWLYYSADGLTYSLTTNSF